jgi:4-amino-4-deoxy-L-arabinose transferase-like glycosyltransferase
MQSLTFSEFRISWLVITAAALVNFSGLNITILEPDGALYAGIAKTMVQTGNYLDLYADGHAWLDKPHFPFWMMALSYHLFGFTTWAYKLPAILWLMVGAYYTYRFAAKLYNEQTARWAVCILLTAQHLVLSNNDVRAEPYLTGMIIASVYHFYRSSEKGPWYHLPAGALFAAFAVMTKGMFALIPIGSAIGGHLLITRQWKQVFHLRWLLAAILIGVFITPELYSLYRQFDQHPELEVFGQKGVSGIRFFFWDSQFGRFMNTGPIRGEGDPFFFLHTLLWAFLPWSLFLYAAFFRRGWKEYYCLCGALVTFVLFSLSRFQLPHYLNILFPFFAIITAQYLLALKEPDGTKFYRVALKTIIIIMFVAIAGLTILYRPQFNVSYLIVAIMLIGAFVILPQRLGEGRKVILFYRACIATFILNLFLNWMWYPDMMQYQSGSTAARYANKELKDQPISFWKVNSYAFPYYLDAPVLRYDSLQLQNAASIAPVMLFTEPGEADALRRIGYRCEMVKSFPHFYVSKLDLPFVNYVTRQQALGRRCLLRVSYN